MTLSPGRLSVSGKGCTDMRWHMGRKVRGFERGEIPQADMVIAAGLTTRPLLHKKPCKESEMQPNEGVADFRQGHGRVSMLSGSTIWPWLPYSGLAHGGLRVA